MTVASLAYILHQITLIAVVSRVLTDMKEVKLDPLTHVGNIGVSRTKKKQIMKSK